MADKAVADVSKLKVVDLRKELKTRGLSSTGDRKELISRLQAAMAQDAADDGTDITLDSDEIDSDAVLDEDDKMHSDLLDDEHEAAVLHQPAPPQSEQSEPADPSEPAEPAASAGDKPHRNLKRKIAPATLNKDKSSNDNDSKETASRKIVLNRSVSTTIATPKAEEDTSDKKPTETIELTKTATNKVKITADFDSTTKLELRAKRFGLPIKMSETERKEARKQRFGQTTLTSASSSSEPLSGNISKLKQRAERFGQSVSRFMTTIENKEKLEKRKAKFGLVN